MKAPFALLMAVIAIAVPVAASAQHQGRPGGAPGAGRGPAQAPRQPAAPAMRQPAPAPAMRQPAPAPAMRQAPPAGFDLGRDIAPQARPPVTSNRPPITNNRPPVTINRPPVANNRPPVTSNRPPVANDRPPVTNNRQRGANDRPPIANNRPGANDGRGRGQVVANPTYRGRRAWDWNRGTVWAPAPAYWGGGFWGSFALGAAAVAIDATSYGTYGDSDRVYRSYRVGTESPGATLLNNYGLSQTPCGPPDLVVIFGPDDSAICAYPNASVGPGEYDLDTSTLSIVSR